MAANTGPDENIYQIPEVLLGDTFNVWKDITNTSVYKLNKMKVYAGVSSDCLEAQTTPTGDLTFILVPNIMTGHTFTNKIEFDNGVQFDGGVTFNGPVVFNAPTFTVNANTVTIDDYNILLGDTGGASDSTVSSVGGGGIILNRGGGLSADWLWNPTGLYGLTGVWAGEGHIGFKGTSSGIRPHGGNNLLVHGTGIRIDGSAATEHGLQVSFAGSGTTADRTVEFLRYSPSGSTAFADVQLRRPTTGDAVGFRPYMNIKDGANRKTIRQAVHTLISGTPVTINSNGQYVRAIANDSTNAEVVGVVSRVFDNDNFEITFLGEIFDINFSQVTVEGVAGLTGSVYYLSPFVAGKLTSSVPQTVNTVHKAVMIATSSNSAIVLPWTGGVLSETITLAESTSNTILISQLNQFKPGDVVQFVARTAGITLKYGSNEAYYPFGAYARADAAVESSTFNVAGMVVATTELSAGSPYNKSFNLMMDGFFSVPGGISAINGGSPGGLIPGNNYFLNAGITGSGPSLEGVTSCLVNPAPQLPLGVVNKPVLLATSPTSGYVYSYRGAVGNVVIPDTQVSLSNMLITDIRATTPQNLFFNVSNNGSPYRVMEFDSTSGGLGNIRVGSSSFTSSSPGAGATLSVAGILAAGDRVANDGSTIICSRFGGVFPQTLNVFGSQHTTGNTVVSYGIRPLSGGQGYSSTNSDNRPRAALELGTGTAGDVDLPIMRFLGRSSVNTAVGGSVSLTELMKVTGSTATFGVNVVSSRFFGPLTGNVTGVADSALVLQNTRTITLDGDIGGQVQFNGGSNVTLTTAIAAGSIVDADIASGTITDSKLAQITSANKVANTATTATSQANINTIVLRDATNSFSVGSGLISCTSTPTAPEHLTRKGYVDSHPMLPKVFAVFTNMAATTPTVTTQRTITNETITIARTAQGTYNINFPAGLFSDGNYVPVMTGQSGNNPICRINSKTATTLNVSVVTGSLAAHDPTSLSLIIFDA